MNALQAILLGLVQGLTEFLPISSSGHLSLAEYFFSVKQENLTFILLLHLATLVSVVIFFARDLLKMTPKMALAIVVGSVPAAIIGLLFEEKINLLFGIPLFVSVELIITGLINLYTDRKLEQHKNDGTETKKEVGIKESIIIGIAQAIAISPGISRSGSTVAAGIWQKLDRETAFRYSFLLSIPAVGGASALELIKSFSSGELFALPLMPAILGCLMSLITGYASLWLFKRVMTQARMEIFGWYCIGLGVLSVVVLMVY